MAKAYVDVVGMVVPQEQPEEEEEGASNDIEALFGDSSDGDAAVPATTDEQVALLASFETVHREQVTRQFMAQSGRLLRPCSWRAPMRRGRRRAAAAQEAAARRRHGQSSSRRRRHCRQRHGRRWPGIGGHGGG
jgi:hypothetical protein